MRKRHDFWLDEQNKDHRMVAKVIKRLKNRNQFASVVRDGIIIVSELREGKIDNLLKLFPWIKDAILSSAPPPPPPDTSGLIAEFRKLLIEQGGNNLPPPPPNYPTMKPIAGLQPVGAPKPLAVSKPIAIPTFDDDDEETLVLKKASNVDASANLMKAMLGLQQ